MESLRLRLSSPVMNSPVNPRRRPSSSDTTSTYTLAEADSDSEFSVRSYSTNSSHSVTTPEPSPTWDGEYPQEELCVIVIPDESYLEHGEPIPLSEVASSYNSTTRGAVMGSTFPLPCEKVQACSSPSRRMSSPLVDAGYANGVRVVGSMSTETLRETIVGYGALSASGHQDVMEVFVHADKSVPRILHLQVDRRIVTLETLRRTLADALALRSYPDIYTSHTLKPRLVIEDTDLLRIWLRRASALAYAQCWMSTSPRLYSQPTRSVPRPASIPTQVRKGNGDRLVPATIWTWSDSLHAKVPSGPPAPPPSRPALRHGRSGSSEVDTSAFPATHQHEDKAPESLRRYSVPLHQTMRSMYDGLEVVGAVDEDELPKDAVGRALDPFTAYIDVFIKSIGDVSDYLWLKVDPECTTLQAFMETMCYEFGRTDTPRLCIPGFLQECKIITNTRGLRDWLSNSRYLPYADACLFP